MQQENIRLSVSDFIALTNQTLDFAYPNVEIEGEVSSYKISQGKYVFFDIKDSDGTLNCFMMVFALRIPIEEGMRVVVRASPKLTKWGRFSLTVQAIRPIGEGSIQKSFEILKKKLEKEGLFAADRKRYLPEMPKRIGVIASTQSAGYADFIKILNSRWGGVEVEVAHVQVQGEVAPDQIIRALNYFNQQPELADVLVLVRGGGSSDDLSAFNDEKLVRAVAASRIPTITGIGHEIDESLVDLVADLQASTPSNAAELLVPDKREISERIQVTLQRIVGETNRAVLKVRESNTQLLRDMYSSIVRSYDVTEREYQHLVELLSAYDPNVVLKRGYALISGTIRVGSKIEITTSSNNITAEVKDVKNR